MKYNFETLVKRSPDSLIDSLLPPEILDSGNVSFHGAEPLYATAPVICDAVSRMADNGRFGYTLMGAAYQRAVVWWMENARKVSTDPDWIVPTLGTIHSLAVAIRLLTTEQESIIVTTPVYYRYEQAAARLNRQTVKVPLIVENGRYVMDFDAIEAAMVRPDTHLFVLCNPHNPIGQIWTVPELSRLADLACRHGVVVFSDEIFAENSLNGLSCPSYLTIQGAPGNCIVATSLGKAYGTTGFNHANMLIPDQQLRDRFIDRRNREHYGSMDPVACESLMAAYTEPGLAWVLASNEVIAANIRLVKEFFATNLPDITVYGGEGSYVIWMDWRSRFSDEDKLMAFLYEKANLHLEAGSHYDYPCFTRMSLACPTHCVVKALASLASAIR